jgi:predicted DNA-binding transcriptional regulator AlpA
MQNIEPEPFLKPEELAKLLSVKTATIADWSRRYADFPHINLPGSIRVQRSKVEQWLNRFSEHPVKNTSGPKKSVSLDSLEKES